MSEKREHAPSASSIICIPLHPDFSAGPGPTTSDIFSCSGSLSCSDLKNGGIYIKMVLPSYGDLQLIIHQHNQQKIQIRQMHVYNPVDCVISYGKPLAVDCNTTLQHCPVSIKGSSHCTEKSDIYLILRLGFAVPVTFTTSASNSFFYRKKGIGYFTIYIRRII